MPESKNNPSQEKPKEQGMSRRAFLRLLALLASSYALGYLSYGRAPQKVRKLIDTEPPQGLPGAIEKIKLKYPEVDQNADSVRWANAILDALTLHDLPHSPEMIAYVLTLIRSSSGFRAIPRAYDNLPTPSEKDLGELINKQPRTGGPMEISYSRVAEIKGISIDAAREYVNTIEGGLESGVGELARIYKLYENVPDRELRAKLIFADWNAGYGASLRYTKGISPSPSVIDTADAVAGADRSQAANYTPLTSAKYRVLGLVGIVKKIFTGIGDSAEYAEARYKEFLEIISFLF